jgi:4-carboxymuconolactone decarboxylase
MSRLPEFAIEDMDERQRAIFSRSGAVARGGVGRGPSLAMLHSPEFATRATHLGEYVLRANVLGPRLTELAILVTARHLSSQFEWWAHAPHALKHGIEQSVIDSIRARKEPALTKEDEQAVYAFAVETYRDRKVSAATFDRTTRLFGMAGVVDLIGILGYYGMLSMFTAVFELSPPELDLQD